MKNKLYSQIEKNKMIIIVCIILFISILSITNSSMWFDETCRVVDPIKGDFLSTIKTSLMFAQPGYMIFMFLWERIFLGTQIEFFIRCSNLIFVPIAIIYAYKIVKAKKWNLWTILLFFVHPMFVYYMDEATPYIVVYSLALAYTYYLFFSDDFNSTKNIIKLNLIYLIGVFFHFIFGFIIIPYIVVCIIKNHNNKKILYRHIKILALFCILYAPLLILYLLKLARVTTGFGIKNILYVIYSFLGMAGLGLSRNDLRAFNIEKISILQIILIALMALICIRMLYIFIKNRKLILKKENKECLICLLVFFAVVFGISFVIKFGVWERHCITAFPLFMIVFIDFITLTKSKKNLVLFTLYIIFIIISSVNIRINYYYQCDDNKGIYKYIEQNNTEKKQYIISNYDDELYNIKKLVGEDYFVNMENSKDEEIINKFLDNKKATLILFEKHSSKNLYNYFDEKEEYKVNNNYNSFKIINSINN